MSKNSRDSVSHSHVSLNSATRNYRRLDEAQTTDEILNHFDGTSNGANYCSNQKLFFNRDFKYRPNATK